MQSLNSRVQLHQRDLTTRKFSYRKRIPIFIFRSVILRYSGKLLVLLASIPLSHNILDRYFELMREQSYIDLIRKILFVCVTPEPNLIVISQVEEINENLFDIKTEIIKVFNKLAEIVVSMELNDPKLHEQSS